MISDSVSNDMNIALLFLGLKIDKRIAVNQQIILIPSTQETCFGHTDHSQALNT
jgi:hypothetical protein